MASAGTVTVDFAAETARFTAELKKVRSDLVGLKKSSEATARSIDAISSGFKRLLGAVALGAGLRAIIKNTQEAEQANALLANALERAGANVAAASADFTEYANSLQKTTTFGDEAIIGVETLLLSFRGLSSGVIKQATADILDLSARTGTDLSAAARTVGRALEDPIEGLTRLNRAGVIFTDAQKDQVKAFVEAGEKGKAQAIILGEIEARYKGAAAAARDTLGGALSGLKNAFGDLLEAKTGLPEATTQLNAFTKILQDPATKRAADSLMGGLVAGLGAVTVAAVAGTNAVIDFFQGPRRDIETLNKQIDDLQGKIDKASRPRQVGRGGFVAPDLEESPRRTGRGRIAANVAAQREDLEALIRARDELVRRQSVPPPTVPGAEFTTPAATGLSDAEIERQKEMAKMLDKFQLDAQEQLIELNDSLAKERTKEMEERLQSEIDFQNRSLENERAMAAFRVSIEEEAQARIIATRQQALQTSLAALQLLGARSNTWAKIHKAASIVEAIRNTYVGVTKALAQGGFWGIAQAAAVGALGFAQVAAIRSSDNGVAFTSGGGAALGSSPNPIFTRGDDAAGGNQQGATSQDVVQVIIQGNVIGNREYTEQLIADIKEAVTDRDVILISPSSRNAQDLVPA